MPVRPTWLKVLMALGIVGGALVSAGILPAAVGVVVATVPTLAGLFHDPPKVKSKESE